ncbi:unnamed protein product, partial [Candidula unifasciata]
FRLSLRADSSVAGQMSRCYMLAVAVCGTQFHINDRLYHKTNSNDHLYQKTKSNDRL